MLPVHILRYRFPLDGVLAGVVAVVVAAVVSAIGLCRLCRVRFRLSSFSESAAEPVLLASLETASTAVGFVLRDGVSNIYNTFIHSPRH